MPEYVPDISEFQQYVDFDALKTWASGVIIRAGLGTVRKDKFFDRNWSEAKRVGLPHAAYWFNYPAYNAPQDEAGLFSAAVQLQPGEGMMGDFENDPGARGWPADGEGWAAAFLNASGPADYAPLWYASPSFVREHNLGPLYPTWPFMVAHYGVNAPDQPVPASLWQFTSTASVAGVSGNCDLSVVLKGSFTDLLWRGSDMFDQTDRDKLDRLYQIATATDAAKDDAGNPIDDHWTAGYTLGHVREIRAALDKIPAGGGLSAEQARQLAETAATLARIEAALKAG